MITSPQVQRSQWPSLRRTPQRHQYVEEQPIPIARPPTPSRTPPILYLRLAPRVDAWSAFVVLRCAAVASVGQIKQGIQGEEDDYGGVLGCRPRLSRT